MASSVSQMQPNHKTHTLFNKFQYKDGKEYQLFRFSPCLAKYEGNCFLNTMAIVDQVKKNNPPLLHCTYKTGINTYEILLYSDESFFQNVGKTLQLKPLDENLNEFEDTITLGTVETIAECARRALRILICPPEIEQYFQKIIPSPA